MNCTSYLLVKYECLSDQWECEADKTPLLIVDGNYELAIETAINYVCDEYAILIYEIKPDRTLEELVLVDKERIAKRK